jgi:hypothetical protein
MSNSLTDLEAYLSAEEDFLKQIDREILNVPTPIRTQIFQNFGMWFRDNHLSLISRVPENSVCADFSSWLTATKANQKIFLKFGYKIKENFFRGFAVLVKHRISVRRVLKN